MPPIASNEDIRETLDKLRFDLDLFYQDSHPLFRFYASTQFRNDSTIIFFHGHHGYVDGKSLAKLFYLMSDQCPDWSGDRVYTMDEYLSFGGRKYENRYLKSGDLKIPEQELSNDEIDALFIEYGYHERQKNLVKPYELIYRTI